MKQETAINLLISNFNFWSAIPLKGKDPIIVKIANPEYKEKLLEAINMMRSIELLRSLPDFDNPESFTTLFKQDVTRENFY